MFAAVMLNSEQDRLAAYMTPPQLYIGLAGTVSSSSSSSSRASSTQRQQRADCFTAMF